MLALAGCNVDLGVDEVMWTCAADRDCGAGARCVAGACVPAPTGRRCVTRTASGVDVRFEVTGKTLTVTAGGQPKEFELPADIVLDAPIAGCCENDCCTERKP